jgi:hypothetical protein
MIDFEKGCIPVTNAASIAQTFMAQAFMAQAFMATI